MIQGGDVGTGVIFIQGSFLLGGSGASGDRVTWSGVIFFFLVTGLCHMARFATVEAEFVLETAVFFFRHKFTKGLRTLRNCSIDLCFICDKIAVLGRRRRAWSSWVLTLVDFIGAIKFASLGYKVGKGSRRRGNTEQLLVYSIVQVTLEHKDLGVIIGTRASSKGGPFLVPLIESTGTLLQIEHILLGKISGDDRDEVLFKGSFEIGPQTEVNRGLAKGSFLTILSPLTSSSANAEVGEGRGDLLVFCGKVVPIEVVIIFQGVPKGLCMSRFAIKGFWHTTKRFGRCRGGHDRC